MRNQGVKNVSFPENVAHVLNEWSLTCVSEAFDWSSLLADKHRIKWFSTNAQRKWQSVIETNNFKKKSIISFMSLFIKIKESLLYCIICGQRVYQKALLNQYLSFLIFLSIGFARWKNVALSHIVYIGIH